MKLELKHITPYLPYELRLTNCAIPMNGRLCELLAKYDYHDKKPILRRTTDLTQDELQQIVRHFFRDSKMPNPKMESVKYDKGFITFYDLDTSQTYVAVKPGVDGNPVMNMSNTFDDYSIFFKMHVDIFGLIEQGLAVDINTLKGGVNDEA